MKTKWKGKQHDDRDGKNHNETKKKRNLEFSTHCIHYRNKNYLNVTQRRQFGQIGRLNNRHN